jgi:hypothetical protein
MKWKLEHAQGKGINHHYIIGLGLDRDPDGFPAALLHCTAKDARLISAAPELFEALELLVDLYQDELEATPAGREHLALARAAIAKASGG